MKCGKKFAAAVVTLALISGCAGVHQATEQARAENATREAAIGRIMVSSESAVPGHLAFQRLGTVGGHCAIDRDSQEELPFAGFLRRNAYLKFGDQADAVIEARAWYISHNMPSSICVVQGDVGELYCCGVAVHFADAQR